MEHTLNVDHIWQNYIDGRWVDNTEKIPVYDPATGKVMVEVAKAGNEEVEMAVQAARRCFEESEWRKVRPIERGRKVMGMAQYLLDHLDEISRVLCFDSGKPWDQAVVEVKSAARFLEYYGSHADKLEGRSIPLGETYFDFTVYEPFGVTAHVIPWNYPMEIAARSGAAALATGNTVILKSPENDPLSIYYLADAAEHVGLPPGCLNIICGYGAEAGAALCAHPDVDQVCFTGSVGTGQKILHSAADKVIPAVMELGGKSAGIVFPDADLDYLVEQAKWGIFMYSGQVCSAMSRIVVHRSYMNELTEALADVASNLTMGHSIENHFVNPLISDVQLERVAEYATVGKSEGELVIGGNVAERDGYFMEPTIFMNVPSGSKIEQEEIFGPVLSIIPFDEPEEAVAIANKSDYGLCAGVFTNDMNKAMRCARDLRAGQIYVNEWWAGGHETPFGGFKKSGFGREKGIEGMLNYVQTKNVGIRIS
ncbi:MAG: aldehyde dehydrogenase family protein [Chloroflexota bacterium]